MFPTRPFIPLCFHKMNEENAHRYDLRCVFMFINQTGQQFMQHCLLACFAKMLYKLKQYKQYL